MTSDISLPSGDISESRILDIKTWYKTETKFDGGRVYISDNSSINFDGVTVISNSTSQDCFTNQGPQGAGIIVKEGSGVVFSNGEISNNQVADTGGAIFLSGGSTGEFNSSVFYNNRGAVVGGGVNTTGAGIGAIFDSGADFNNCTFCGF